MMKWKSFPAKYNEFIKEIYWERETIVDWSLPSGRERPCCLGLFTAVSGYGKGDYSICGMLLAINYSINLLISFLLTSCSLFLLMDNWLLLYLATCVCTSLDSRCWWVVTFALVAAVTISSSVVIKEHSWPNYDCDHTHLLVVWLIRVTRFLLFLMWDDILSARGLRVEKFKTERSWWVSFSLRSSSPYILLLTGFPREIPPTFGVFRPSLAFVDSCHCLHLWTVDMPDQTSAVCANLFAR